MDLAKNISAHVLPPGALLKEVLAVLNREAAGVVFIAGDDERILGLVTDGDVRRAVLKGATLGSPIQEYLNQRFAFGRASWSREENVKLLTEGIRHLPILDDGGRLVDFLSWAEIWRTPIIEPTLGGNELKYVADCITSTWISSQGPYVRRFEKAFADLHAIDHALTTSSGTTALHVTLVALGVGPGDEVIVPDLTFAATANAVLHAGAKPVLVDVDEDCWNLDPARIREAITGRTKAIIPVHLYGHPCDMDSIMEIADSAGLFVVEDCAEALGARYKGRLVGTFGQAGCFSFFSNKVITTGEGGMVMTKDAELSARIMCLRDHGMRPGKRYWHDIVGFNYRMTNVQAAIGLAQLEQVERFLENRQSTARLYAELLTGLPGITLPRTMPWAENIHWLYSILVDQELAGISRDELMNVLNREGIETRRVFYPLHQQPPYLAEGCFEVTERLSSRGVSLPSGNGLSLAEVRRVCDRLKEEIENRRVIGRARTAYS